MIKHAVDSIPSLNELCEQAIREQKAAKKAEKAYEDTKDQIKKLLTTNGLDVYAHQDPEDEDSLINAYLYAQDRPKVDKDAEIRAKRFDLNY